MQPSAAASMSPSGCCSNSCIRHSRTQPSATSYPSEPVMLTVERSPGAAVVIAPGSPPLPLEALPLVVESTTPLVVVVEPIVSSTTPLVLLVVAVLKSKGLPPRLRVADAVSVVAAPRTPWRAHMIEIRISTFLGGAIFAVTSSDVTLRRKLGEEEVQERWKTNDAPTMRFQNVCGTRGRHEPF